MEVLCPKRVKFWGCPLIKAWEEERTSLSSEYKRQSLGTSYSTCILSIMANRSEVWGRELTQIHKGTWVWQLCWFAFPVVFTHPSPLLIAKSGCAVSRHKTSCWNLWHPLIPYFTMTVLPNAYPTPLNTNLTKAPFNSRRIVPPRLKTDTL